MFCAHCSEHTINPYHEQDGQAWCTPVCMREWMAQNIREVRREKYEQDQAALRACGLYGVTIREDGNRYEWECNGYVCGPFVTRRAAISDATTFLAAGREVQ